MIAQITRIEYDQDFDIWKLEAVIKPRATYRCFIKSRGLTAKNAIKLLKCCYDKGVVTKQWDLVWLINA